MNTTFYHRKRLSILGSTGSIGLQALDVAEKLNCPVTALAANTQVEKMEQQIRKYHPPLAVLYDEKAAADLRVRVQDLPVRVETGMDGLKAAAAADTDMVLNSVVGMIGLQPTMTAIEAGHDVALANKETLVAGGSVVTEAVKQHKIKLLPVDSEHSAIFQCLQGAPVNRALKRIILTASGGPFFGKTVDELKKMTLSDALKHPNWSMGAKITVDSATMMNKGLELIEARWLFDTAPETIDIVIHRESVVHSLIEFDDNSVLAQLGVPDMRIPIQYALTWPERYPSPVKQLDLADYAKLTFYKPDYETFICMNICRTAITRGGLAPAAVNAANEQAVALFRQGRIGFMDIGRLVGRALEYPLPSQNGTVEQILEADRYVREKILSAAERI